MENQKDSREQFTGNDRTMRVRLVLTAGMGVMAWAMLGALNPHGWQAHGADRTTCLLPLPSDAASSPPIEGVLPDAAFESSDAGWKSYLRIWRAHHADPSDANIRRFLGLPLKGVVDAKPRRGRSAISWLGWRPGGYQQIDTPHFSILTRATPAAGKLVAEDLERCYWIWTQVFFPLWEGRAQVTSTMAGLDPQQSVKAYLQSNRSRITIRRKLKVVLFRDAAEYQRSLQNEVPGVERSTGYYSENRSTIFLYASDESDAATRRHELVHQLFREATRSSLGNDMPGERSGFWLVEGIAGYFESLHLDKRIATVGGWDSSRLQYARYRVLIGGDMMPMNELTQDGRIAVQKRQDLARFYAHAIAITHLLMDGGQASERHWIYQQLATLYEIKNDLPGGALGGQPERRLTRFLKIDDAHLRDNPARPDLVRLCLAGCELTDAGLKFIRPSPALSWLDLSRLRAVSNDSVRWLVPEPRSLQQLTLELTGINPELNDWLAKATNLREVDLSWTAADDSVIQSLSGAAQLDTLWMTGTKITDQSIPRIARMPKLQSVDLQRTRVSDAGIARLRKARPNLSINPLELVTP